MEHNVAVRIASRTIENWTNYSVESSMLEPADSFRLNLGNARREVFEICKPDMPCQVLIDDTSIITGFIDDRTWAAARGGGSTVAITGRDKGGRLIDESAPLLSFNGLGIKDLASRLVADWFETVSLSNARNRRLVRGKRAKGGKTARASSEPAIDTSARSKKKVTPGESIWHVMSSFLEEAGLIAWSSADGKEFIVGLPNYNQEPQFHFFLPKKNSPREALGNVESVEIVDSVAERYSKIIACGAGKGSKGNYGKNVTKLRGVALNNPRGEHGVGKDFTARKVLLLSDNGVRDNGLAGSRAAREMAQRDSSGHTLRVTCKGHSQTRQGSAPVLFAFDNMATVEIEELGIVGQYLITTVNFEHSRQGETATIDLVPRGTILRL